MSITMEKIYSVICFQKSVGDDLQITHFSNRFIGVAFYQMCPGSTSKRKLLHTGDISF